RLRTAAFRCAAGRWDAAHDRAGGFRLRGSTATGSAEHDRVGGRNAGWGGWWRFWSPMKAAVLGGVGRIEVRDVRCPDPGPREVLLRVAAVGLCGTDLHIFAGDGNYNRDERGDPIPLAREPQILGHEIAGEVEQAGTSVRDLGPGARVVIDQGRSCVSEGRSPTCEYCASGDSHQCEFYQEHGITGLPGGLAEYVVIPAVNAVRIESALDAATPALTEPLGCVVHAADVLLRTPARYAIQGGRRGKGDNGRQVRHVLICGAGLAPLVRKQATVLLYGHGHAGVDLSVLSQLQFREPVLLSPVGASGGHEPDGRPSTYVRALRLIERGSVDVAPMITHRYRSLDAVPGAFTGDHAAPHYIKGVVTL